MGILRRARTSAHMNLDRREARIVSLDQLDLCRISILSCSLSMFPTPVTSKMISGWKSRLLSGLRTKVSISVRRSSMSSREVSKEIYMSNCSFMALERVMFSIHKALSIMLGT